MDEVRENKEVMQGLLRGWTCCLGFRISRFTMEKPWHWTGFLSKWREGAVVSIIGANGAGKSTILKAVSGMTPLTSGEIRFQDRNITGLKTPAIVKLGLVHVPEGRKLFPFLTVQSNIELGASTRKDRDGIKKDMEEVFNYFPVLETRCTQKAGTLSGGEQQMLAIGRGLMAKPKLLLLDEPSSGIGSHDR